LKLNRDKTRLLEFGRFAISNREKRKQGKPETFDFLGFTHICSRARSDGRFSLRRLSIAKKLTAKLKIIRQQVLRNRHRDVYVQGEILKRIVQGYFNYHAVPGNQKAMNLFRTEIGRMWLRALRRRGQSHPLTWKKHMNFINMFILRTRVLHPYPNERLQV